MSTNVTVYGEVDCAKCNALKGALHEAGISYDEKPAAELIDPSMNKDWRTNGAVNAVAQLVQQGWNLSEVPIVRIGEDYIDASNKESIEIQGSTIHIVESTVHCEGGACRIQPREAVAAVA